MARKAASPGRGDADRKAIDVVYGRKPVLEALRGRRAVQRIMVQDGNRALADEVAGWLETSGDRPRVEGWATGELDEAAGTPEHQGVVAAVGPFEYASPTDLLRDHRLIAVLDRIQDPHNLGAIIRTADATGAAVVLPRHRSADVTPAVVKASAGATEHVQVARARNLTDFVTDAKEAGFWIYGADAEAQIRYDAEEYAERVVMCLGSEGEGLGRRLADSCDVLVSIPLLGRVESLNVSVAAAVLLFEVRRRWTAGGGEA